MSRPDDELPESRREYVAPPIRPVPPPTPVQAARDAREGAGLGRLTGPEQVIAAVIVMGYAGAHTLVTRPWDGPYTGKQYLALLAPVVLANGFALFYSDRRPPWPGPSRWVTWQQARQSRRRARVRLPRTRAAVGRFGRWWCRPGRLGLAVALVGAALVVTILASSESDDQLLKDLRARGVEASATVGDTDYAKGARTDADVHFAVDGVRRVEPLAFIDGEARSVPEGASVTVVYDPNDPHRVLLASQLRSGYVRDGHIMAWLTGAVAVAGFIWWVVQSPHRRAAAA